MKTYKYIGDAPGIPGLAHEIHEEQIVGFTDEQLKVWRDALASGVYVEETFVSAESSRLLEDAPKPRKNKKADDMTAEGD